MKKINHNDLTHYFLRPHQELPRSYIDSCEKFFRELKNLKLARLTAENVQKKKEQDQYGKTHSVSIDTWKPEAKKEPVPAVNSSDDLPF